MKKLMLSLCVFFLLSGVAMADFNLHPRFALIDTLVKTLINSVRDAQALYFQANSEYFQGIMTPDTIQDGLTDIAPNWAVHPTDRTASWKDFAPSTFRSNFRIPFQIQIHVYQSPRGWGWILMIDVYRDGLGPDQFGIDGGHWRYRHHEGLGDVWGHFDVWYIIPEEQ